MKYNYHQEQDEFCECPDESVSDFFTGNMVVVTTDEEGTIRFRVEIDAYGDVLAAFNRLVQKLIPTFVFPVTKVVP